MFAHSDARGGDMLTRTTVQVAADLPAPAIARLIATLQRVPGVLVADWLPSSARVVIAHDAAVPVAALAAAAKGTGVHTRIVSPAPLPAIAAAGIAATPDLTPRRIFAVAVALLIVAAIFLTADPRLASNHLVLPLLLGGMWAFVVAHAILRRNR
jgi:hypothetical protein